MFCFSLETVPTLTWLYYNEAAAVASHCKLVVVLEFDAAATSFVHVLDSYVVSAFYLVVNLVVVVLNPLNGFEIHIDVVLLVLPVLQEVLTKLILLWISCDIFNY